MHKIRFSCSEADRKCSETDTTNPGFPKDLELNDGFDKNHFAPTFLSRQFILNADNL